MKTQVICLKNVLILFCILFTISCISNPDKQNRLSAEEQSKGWKLLYDGTSLNGWHIFNRGIIPSAWSSDSGNLVCNPHAKNVKHGDLVTDSVYSNFDLVFDWKISKAGNSGLFINVQERPDLGTTFSTGPEYQLLDDKNTDTEYLKNPTHKAAAIFGVIANNTNTLPTDSQWNHSRILQENGKVSFWLNGTLTIQTDFQSAEWKKQVAGSSMSHYPEFGTATRGHIALQDWTNGVAFQNIKIKTF